MTKSIEAQAMEYADKQPPKAVCSLPNEHINAFMAGTKARDEQWLKVVNELRDCTQDIIKNKMVHPFEYHHYSREDMVELLKSALTKADQMMKEMI